MPKPQVNSNDNNRIFFVGGACLSGVYSVIVAVFVLLATFNPYQVHVSRGISQTELALSIDPPTTGPSRHTAKPRSSP